MGLIEKVSSLMYKKLYNRYKYKDFINNSFVRKVIYPPYALFNIYYSSKVLKTFQKKIDALPEGTQVFFIGRKDFGTHLYMLHYLRLWQQERGPVALIIFTNEPENIIKLTQILLPGIPIICANSFFDHLALILFGHQMVFYDTLLHVYARLAAKRPDFLHMFDLAESPHVKYNSYLDPELSHVPMSDFVKAYHLVRKQFDYRWDVFKDCCLLNYRFFLPSPNFSSDTLKKNLSIQKPYVILNINTKPYQGPAKRRIINYPERYEVLIDTLITKGYQVVIQGRGEQPVFAPRPGLIDYSKSSYASIENDLILYAGCAFVIASKSGVEIFATICNVPILGLNYTEILGMQPSKKMRFYPKYLKDPSQNKIFSWKEHITSPQFFDIGNCQFGEPVEYVDMEEGEMMEALEEFIPLLERSEEEWEDYTPAQQEFKQMLSPLHMELFLSKAVPCDTYLQKAKEKHNGS